ADAVTALIHDGQGRSYAAASLPLKLLAVAALLRVVSQLAYPLVIGSGRPQMAVRLSAATLILLSAGMLFVGLTISAESGTVAMATVWLTVHPLLLIWLGRYLQRHWNIGAKHLFQALVAPFVAVGILASTVAAGRLLIGSGSPTLQLGMILTLSALACVGLLLHDRRREHRSGALTAGH